MINPINTDSTPKSPSSNHRTGEIQDTEPIDESVTLNSSLLETTFQNLYDDTELVDNGDIDCFNQVVDDSEDEDVAAPVMSILLESNGSNEHECNQTGALRLDYVDSQEPGESTQENALGFVDEFLMGKDFDFSPVGVTETSRKRKSPAFSGAKGRQSLVKRMKCSSPTRKMSVFDWGSNQCDVSESEKSPATCLKRGEDHGADDDRGVKKGLMDLCEDGLTQGNILIPRMDVQLEDEALNEEVEPAEEFIDVGIGTQIAAEAMSALLHTPCAKEEACEPDPIPEKISEKRDNVSNLSRRNNDMVEDGPERDDGSAPRMVRNSKKKKNFSKIERPRKKVSATTCLLNLCEWKHPRAQRSCLMQRHRVSFKKPLVANSVKDRSEATTLSSELQVPLSGRRQASSCQSVVNALKVVTCPRKIHSGSHESPCSKDIPRPFLVKELTRLGGPGNVGDFLWKDSRRRRNLAHVRVLFSQNLGVETIKQQKKIMVQLGVSPATSSADSTHFIADRFARTKNMLEAIALGKPVVTPLWLESCGQTRCLIDEKSYILKDSKKEKEGFCLLTSLARAKKRPLLKGLKVCITHNIKPSRSMIADLVKVTQGQVVEISEITSPDDLLILSCEEDRNLCLPFINQGAVVYTSELLLNGIVIQKLEYARHGLFSIADKKNQRNPKFPTTRPLLSAY